MTARLYATKSPDGRYVTLGASAELATTRFELLSSLGDWAKHVVRGWTVVPVAIADLSDEKKEDSRD